MKKNLLIAVLLSVVVWAGVQYAIGSGGAGPSLTPAQSAGLPGNNYGTLTATGANQATAAQIAKHVTNVTSGDTKGVRLPTGSPPVGDEYEVLCTVASDPGGYSGGSFQHYCNVYPGSGWTISPFSANAADVLPTGTVARYRYKGSSAWVTEHGSLKTSDGNRVAGLLDVYGPLTLGGGWGSSVSQLQLVSLSGNQINYTNCGDANSDCGNRISLPANAVNALQIWSSGDGKVLAVINDKNGSESFTSSIPLIAATGETIGGKLMLTNAVTGTVAHAGGGQGAATVLSNVMVNICSATSSNDSVRMPTGPTGLVTGQMMIIINTANTNMTLFPAPSGFVGPTMDTSVTSGGGKSTICYLISPAANQWVCNL